MKTPYRISIAFAPEEADSLVPEELNWTSIEEGHVDEEEDLYIHGPPVDGELTIFRVEVGS